MHAAMKPNKIIQTFQLVQVWVALSLILITIDHIDGIRVYEGTNFPAPIPKKTAGFSKKSLYISKRSWSAAEEKLIKTDGKSKEANKRSGTEGSPSLYKIKFSDKNFMQYLKYIKEIPRLEEYTFCLWYKSENLTHEQTIFTYSVNKNELLLRFWLNPKDSILGMAIRENVVYMVPANIRRGKWYHICQSWNGILGEWQVFLDGKRIGAGVLPRYKGTYIPEGGEVILGQELIGLNNRLDDRMEGEIFGFNLVDEAVPQDQAVFINSQYRPNVQVGVPPFKKLPPIKKTYQEIKAYISTLPRDPSEQNDEGEGINVIKKQKESYPAPPKRNRGSHRHRYPPMRKVVVYNRDDRQLSLNEAEIELNRTKPVLSSQDKATLRGTEVEKEAQELKGNYSIHSYRSGKDDRKAKNYEIYEIFEDDGFKKDSEDELTSEQSLERKARQNFNLFTARQANKVYTLSSSLKDPKKRKFHFETRMEKPEKTRVIFPEQPTSTSEAATKRTLSDPIPVYEIEIVPERRKRSADGQKQKQFITGNYNSRDENEFKWKGCGQQPGTRNQYLTTITAIISLITEDPNTDSNGFRRLPQIPESFINIFTQNASKSEMEQKLDQFFPRNNTTEAANVIAEATESVKASQVVEDTVLISLPATNNAQVERFTTEDPIPSFSPIPSQVQSRENLQVQLQPKFTTPLSNPGPVNFPTVQEFNPRPQVEPARTSVRFSKPENAMTQTPIMERRTFDISSGTDLVMRSYGECTADRGSPVRDKGHLIVSWADTPVRIFGGAEVEGARNECGHF